LSKVITKLDHFDFLKAEGAQQGAPNNLTYV